MLVGLQDEKQSVVLFDNHRVRQLLGEQGRTVSELCALDNRVVPDRYCGDIEIAVRLPFVLGYERKQIQVPYDGTFWSEDVWIGEDCLNVLQVDFEQNYNMLKNDVFGTMRSVPAPEDVPQEEVYYEDQGY